MAGEGGTRKRSGFVSRSCELDPVKYLAFRTNVHVRDVDILAGREAAAEVECRRWLDQFELSARGTGGRYRSPT